MSTTATAAAAPAAASFTPVALRQRHDGWTPQKQIDLVKALAITGCVVEACGQVKMSTTAAYALYNRADAASLRQAWDAALDQATVRLSDAMMSRAIHGVVQPIFYKGQQVGEKRIFNERLGMWVLRHRAPERYGAWRDRAEFRRTVPDAVARILQHALRTLVATIVGTLTGRPPADTALMQTVRFVDDPDAERQDEDDDAYLRDRRRAAEDEAWRDRLDAIDQGRIDPDPDAVAALATSARRPS